MRLRMGRRRRIGRIEGRISSLRDRAADLLEREQADERRLSELRDIAPQPAGRLRSARRARALRRTQRRRERLHAQRTELVEREIRAILLGLQQASTCTRERLDRELERLTPLEREWESLRCAFDLLEETIETPALCPLARRWQGELEIPEFPVTEHQGYIKPFPPQAILF